ncbi:MAG: polysaccharide biosynthesis protein [Anaerolineales bacterium]|nr:polysaccharide biosynthesis protein [Anaerolineales bacterium]
MILLDSNESGLHDLIVDLKFSFTNADESQNIIVPALADITYRPSLEYVFATYRPEVVFHAAAYKHVTMLEMYPSEAVRVNIGGTLNVAELSAAYEVERFVLISTDKAVNPTSVMGASKRLCELLVYALDAHKTLFTAVRFGNVLGSRGSVVPTFNRQIDSGGPVTVTDPEMKRYFMSIPEAVNLVLHAACLTKGHDLFMLEMGELVPIVDLAERMIRMRGLRPYADISIEFVGMRAGEKLYEELQFNGELPHPTIHPKILELVKSQNGLNKISFLDKLRYLQDNRLPDYRETIWDMVKTFDPIYEELPS